MGGKGVGKEGGFRGWMKDRGLVEEGGGGGYGDRGPGSTMLPSTKKTLDYILHPNLVHTHLIPNCSTWILYCPTSDSIVWQINTSCLNSLHKLQFIMWFPKKTSSFTHFIGFMIVLFCSRHIMINLIKFWSISKSVTTVVLCFDCHVSQSHMWPNPWSQGRTRLWKHQSGSHVILNQIFICVLLCGGRQLLILWQWCDIVINCTL